MRIFMWMLCLLLLTTSCASKRYTKKAVQYEEAGLIRNAARNYYEAVLRKKNNIEAKLGLTRTGQIYLDEYLNSFHDYYKAGIYQQAVYIYRTAEAYYERVKAVGVDLEFPGEYRIYYEQAKEDYLGKSYERGLELLHHEDFEKALEYFREIMKVDENYKDAKEQYNIARYEPKYREAIENLEEGHYRAAYYAFSDILEGAGMYKQTGIYKDEALEKATITILVTDVNYNKRQYRAGAEQLNSLIRESLSNLKSPFVKLIERSSLNASVFKSTGTIDLKAANLAGVRAVLSSQLNQYNLRNGRLLRTPKKGYLKEVIKLQNEAGVGSESITYHKVEYEEFEAKNEAEINVNFSLISTETGEILISDNFNRDKTDEVHYAVFEGDGEKLVPGYWKYEDSKSVEDVVNDEKIAVMNLQNLLKSKQEITPANKLMDDLVNRAVGSISYRINNYNPEKK